MRKVFDLTTAGIDFVFRENNWEQRYAWESAEGSNSNYSSLLKAVAAFSNLWLPEYFEIDIAPTEFGSAIAAPITTRVTISLADFTQLEQVLSTSINEAIAKQSKGDNSKEYNLVEIRSSLYGWSRIILPKNTAGYSQWGVVCPDSIYPRNYESKPAPTITASSSIWLRMEDAQHASNIHLTVIDFQNATLKIELGLSFFNPLNDPRDSDHKIGGIEIQQWQKLHLDNLENIKQKLYKLNWNTPKTSD
jgi:hypothetical protein